MAENESGKMDEGSQEKTDQGTDNTGEDESGTAVLEEGQEEGKETREDQEIEIIREGSQPSKSDPSTPAWVQPRISKLSAQKNQAKEEAENARSELIQVQERNKILELALEQSNGVKTVQQPNPEEFEGGYSDPEYIKKNNEYNQSFVKTEIAKQVEQVTKNISVSNNQRRMEEAFEVKQEKHIERASKLRVKDFNEAQEKLVDILGVETVKAMIQTFPDSEVIIYGLAKDSAESQRIASFIQTEPLRAWADIAEFRKDLKIKPKSNNPVADPDEPIEGAEGSNTGHFGKKLEKLRERAQKNEPGIMKKILELKKMAREKGIKLE